MSTDPSAYVYVGVLLTEKKAKELFGAKYVTKVRSECEHDSMPIAPGNKFCGLCGSNAEYQEKVRDGIEDLVDLEYLSSVKKSGLEVYVDSDSDNSDINFVILGKSLVKNDDFDFRSGAYPFSAAPSVAAGIETKLRNIGINQKAKYYLVKSWG
ncbi:MAG: hypothetical protein V1839_02830 [archaeon]